jgi:uncharacterized protein YjbI with pentapeptide repeats
MGGLIGLIAGLGLVLLCQCCVWLRGWSLRRWGRPVSWCKQARRLPPGVSRALGHAMWALGVIVSGALLSEIGLLPVRLPRTGYWLARNHGQGADLRGAVLPSASLAGADLYEAELRGADLQAAQLRHASLWCARLTGADLQGADLSGARLLSADLRGTKLNGADMSGAVLIGADMAGADLADVSLTGAVYDCRTHWPAGFDAERHGAVQLGPGVTLRGANLRNADLRYENLRDADLSAANLTGAELNGADMRGARLRGATVADERAGWYEALDLDGADLRGADLTGTSLDSETVRLTGAFYDSHTRWPGGFNPLQSGAVHVLGSMLEIKQKSTDRVLMRVNADALRGPTRLRLFHRASLPGADLRGFDLHQMDLSGAKLTGADLSAADLRDADLASANLSGADLAGTLYSLRTHWPAGLDPQEFGALKADE